MSSSKFVVRNSVPFDVIHGVVNFTGLTGMGVVKDSADPANLKLATATRAHCLVRDIVAEIGLEETVFSPNLETPVLLGTEASARKVLEAEVEGAEYLETSGTGAIDENTAADTALGYGAGKLRVKQAGDELSGYLRAQLDPLFPDDGGPRVLVELI